MENKITNFDASQAYLIEDGKYIILSKTFSRYILVKIEILTDLLENRDPISIKDKEQVIIEAYRFPSKTTKIYHSPHTVNVYRFLIKIT